MRNPALRISLVVALLATSVLITSQPVRADSRLIELRPPIGPAGTRLLLQGNGAQPFSTHLAILHFFNTMDECLYAVVHDDGEPSATQIVTADANGNFTIPYTVRDASGTIRFSQINSQVCFQIVPTPQLFPETGKSVSDIFLAYWYTKGNLPQQGLPITEEFIEKNAGNGQSYRVQYFERARFEHHPENPFPYDILLGLLGTEQFKAKYPQGVASLTGDLFPGDTGDRGCSRFVTVNQDVCGPFLRYWRDNGGLEQQGYPISPVFLETNPTDGRKYPTQYFERARFEYHQEYANTPSAVLLGLLGREQYLARYATPPPAPPKPQVTVTPQQGPNGTWFAVLGAGFRQNTTYYIQVNGDYSGHPSIRFDDPSVRSDANGFIFTAIRLASDSVQYPYLLRIAGGSYGGPVFAATRFMLYGPAPGPSLAVLPAEGRPGETFAFAGSGFTPNGAYDLRVQSADRQTTFNFDSPGVDADSNGILRGSFIASTRRPVGPYVVEILTRGSSPRVVASAAFSVVAGTTASTPFPPTSPSTGALPGTFPDIGGTASKVDFPVATFACYTHPDACNPSSPVLFPDYGP